MNLMSARNVKYQVTLSSYAVIATTPLKFSLSASINYASHFGFHVQKRYAALEYMIHFFAECNYDLYRILWTELLKCCSFEVLEIIQQFGKVP